MIETDNAISLSSTLEYTTDHATTPRAPFLRYLFWFVSIPAVLYVAAFFLVLTASFEQWSPSHWGPMLEWPFDIRHVDADVVIFGDSSAFIGVDPRIVNQRLGVKSVVLPNTIGSLPVTNDLALRTYLAHNAAPKLVVFYFTAWDLDYEHANNVRLFEGEEMLLRHAGWPAILHYGLRHPGEMLAFPLRLYSTFGPGMLRSRLQHVDRERETEQTLGHVDDVEAFPAMSEPCTLPRSSIEAAGTESVRRLASAYQNAQTQVMIYLAPVPGCSNVTAQWLDGEGRGLAAPPRTLPPSAFVGDTYFAHLRPPYVATASEMLAESLRAKLASPRPLAAK